MIATARFKQLLFLLAGLALVIVGLTGLTSAAQADDTTGGEECVETLDSFTAWVNEGPEIQTAENTPPGVDTDTVRYLPAGTLEVGNGDAVEEIPGTPSQWWNFSPNNAQGPQDYVPDFPVDNPGGDPRGEWQGPHTVGGPSQELTGTFQQGGGNSPWFHREPGTAGTPGQEETFHTEYLWQKQVRTLVPGQECDDDDEDKCPTGTHAGESFPVAGDPESCDDDKPVIEPTDGNNPGNPGNNPGNGPSTHPGKSPSSNPGSNPQGSNQPNNGVTPVQAPGAQVPSAVDAGLAPTQGDLTGTGGGLNLLGLGTALLGAGLLGFTVRPRRGRKLAG